MPVYTALDVGPRWQPLAQHQIAHACTLGCRARIDREDLHLNLPCLSGILRQTNPMVTGIPSVIKRSIPVSERGSAGTLSVHRHLDALDPRLCQRVLLSLDASGNNPDFVEMHRLQRTERDRVSGPRRMRSYPAPIQAVLAQIFAPMILVHSRTARFEVLGKVEILPLSVNVILKRGTTFWCLLYIHCYPHRSVVQIHQDVISRGRFQVLELPRESVAVALKMSGGSNDKFSRVHHHCFDCHAPQLNRSLPRSTGR